MIDAKHKGPYRIVLDPEKQDYVLLDDAMEIAFNLTRGLTPDIKPHKYYLMSPEAKLTYKVIGNTYLFENFTITLNLSSKFQPTDIFLHHSGFYLPFEYFEAILNRSYPKQEYTS